MNLLRAVEKLEEFPGDLAYFLFRKLPGRLMLRVRNRRHLRQMRRKPDPFVPVTPASRLPRPMHKKQRQGLALSRVLAPLCLVVSALILGVGITLVVWSLQGQGQVTREKPAKSTEPLIVAAPAKATCKSGSSRCVAYVTLPADGSKSPEIEIDAVVPDTWDYSFSGPSGTVVYWEDFGDSAPIDEGFDLGHGRKGWGVRDGVISFSAPPGGGKVLIQSHPHRDPVT